MLKKHGMLLNLFWIVLPKKKLIPWVSPLTEGAETGCLLHYGPVWYRTPKEVGELASVLTAISCDIFREGFLPDLMADYNVYPEIWDEKDTEGLFNYVWGHFQTMVQFYRVAGG